MMNFDFLDHLSFPVFVLEVTEDLIPRYVAFNAYARKQSRRPLRDYIDRTAQEVYPGKFGTIAYDNHTTAALSGQRITYQLELPIAGDTRVIRTTLSPVRDEHDRIRWFFGSSQDVTMQKNADVAQDAFDKLSDEKTQFIAIAAHDLRAPMRNIAILAGMLRENLVDQEDRQIELINMIEKVAQTSMTLISDVLSNAEHPSSADKSSAIDLQAMCRDITNILDPRDDHDVSVPALHLQCDRKVLQIALRNMIENAFKHTEQSCVAIDINVSRISDKLIKFTIFDNGGGFTSGALAFLDGGAFEVDSGYGLFGVKRLVTKHGGMIRVTNKSDGSGARVELTLPGTIMNDGKRLLLPGCAAHARNATGLLRHLRA
jgi:signal transduction histidine kinase